MEGNGTEGKRPAAGPAAGRAGRHLTRSARQL